MPSFRHVQQQKYFYPLKIKKNKKILTAYLLISVLILPLSLPVPYLNDFELKDIL